MTFGEWLQTKRKEHGLRQVDLAGQLGITSVYLSRLETDMQDPSTELLRKALLLFRDDGYEIRATVDLAGLVRLERDRVSLDIGRLLSAAIGEGIAATATRLGTLDMMSLDIDYAALGVRCLVADWLCFLWGREAGQWKLTGLQDIQRGGTIPQAAGVFAINLIELREAIGIDLAEINEALEVTGSSLLKLLEIGYLDPETFYLGKDDGKK